MSSFPFSRLILSQYIALSCLCMFVFVLGLGFLRMRETERERRGCTMQGGVYGVLYTRAIETCVWLCVRERREREREREINK